MDIDSGYGTAPDTGGPISTAPEYQAHPPNVEKLSGRGQTDAEIQAQTRKIEETAKGLWSAAQTKVSSAR